MCWEGTSAALQKRQEWSLLPSRAPLKAAWRWGLQPHSLHHESASTRTGGTISDGWDESWTSLGG